MSGFCPGSCSTAPVRDCCVGLVTALHGRDIAAQGGHFSATRAFGFPAPNHRKLLCSSVSLNLYPSNSVVGKHWELVPSVQGMIVQLQTCLLPSPFLITYNGPETPGLAAFKHVPSGFHWFSSCGVGSGLPGGCSSPHIRPRSLGETPKVGQKEEHLGESL